jgi:hypothetical protein
LPIEHDVQFCDPSISENEPTEQGRHAVAPLEFAYFPVGHWEHVLEPSKPEKDPAEHGWHAEMLEAPTAVDAVPLMQLRQDVLPFPSFSEYFPVGH